MSEDQFWLFIEECFANRDLPSGVEVYEARLSEVSQQEVIDFQRALNAVMARAYTWDLIAGACFLGCGQSDDGFEDFRAWLISRGHTEYKATLSDCNHIATFDFLESPTEEWYCEELHLLPGEIGGEEDNEDWPYLVDPDKPVGTPVELTQEFLSRSFPILWERFGNRFMIGIP